MLGIPEAKFLATRCELARFQQFLPEALDAIVVDLLSVMRRVGLTASAIKIALPNEFWRQTGRARDAVDNFFHDQHPLRSTEATEGGVRGEIGFQHRAAEGDVRNVVGVIEMKDRAIRHCAGKV